MMPNRILKESICTSENIDLLSPFAEIAFYRLMVNCDDYGRMDARPKIIKSRLFPLKDASEDDVISWLKEMVSAELITIYYHDGKPYLQMNTWDRHQQVRNHKSKYPSPDDADCEHLKSIDINCNQLQSNDSKCPRNPIQSESVSESLSESNAVANDDDEMIPVTEARKIQLDHDTLLEAAKNAGFRNTEWEIQSLIQLYAEHGLQKMLDAIESCVEHSAPNLAYLKACLSGKPKEKPKEKPPGKVLNAQNFEQRDYSDVQDQMMRDLARELAEFNAKEGA